MMPRYDAVLFDVDGTLLHSRPGILDTFSYTFRNMGRDPGPDGHLYGIAAIAFL